MAEKATPKSDTSANVVSLKITLVGLKPPVWRRVLVLGATTLERLSDAILAGMGWTGGHMHSFTVAGRDYGDPKMLEDVANEKKLTLNEIIATGVKRFDYTYDFGDNWDHQVLIEKIEPAAPGQIYPVCVAGKRNCPPEDSGGPWGYQELLEILANPKHRERDERLEWLGAEDFDPEHFDIERINVMLAARG